MLGLFLDDRPIALKVNFVAGDGAFVFKTAYDEAFSRFSPGDDYGNDRRRGSRSGPRHPLGAAAGRKAASVLGEQPIGCLLPTGATCGPHRHLDEKEYEYEED